MNVVLLCVWVHAWKLCENTDFKKNKGVVGPVQGWIGKHVCISHQQKITPAPHPGTMMQIALQWPHMQASVNKSVKTIHFSLTRAIAASLFSFAICLAICKDILAQGGQSTWPEGQWDQCHNGIVFALWPCGCKSDHFSHPQHKWSISWPLCRACGGCVLHQCQAVEKAPNYSCNFKMMVDFCCLQWRPTLQQHNVTCRACASWEQKGLAASKASAGIHIISKSGLDKLPSSFAACTFVLQPWEATIVVLPHIMQVLHSNLFQYASVVHFQILNIGCISFCCLVFSFMRKAWRQYASQMSHFCWHMGQPMKFWMENAFPPCSLTSSIELCDGSVQIWWVELHNRQGLKQFHNRAKGKHYLTGQGNAWKQFAS